MPDPASMPDLHAALVLFPSEDTWSSLQSLVWAQTQGALDRVFIYQTADRRSVAAAERLRRFCSRRWPTLRVVLPGEPGTGTAAGVLERVRDWQRFQPAITRWLLDVTGATRPMLGALPELLAASAACEAFYRDLDGTWQRLRLVGSGRLDATPLSPAIAAESTDVLPVSELVECLAADVAEVRLRGSREPERLTLDELRRLVTSGGACNWEWSRMYATALERPVRIDEFTFADFVAAALLAMGIRNVRTSLKVVSTGPKPVEQILDLVVNRCGQLYVFDCRARDEQRDPGPETPLPTLEGLQPVCVALRPNRWATDAERALAAIAGRAHVVDANGCRRLFSWLGQLLGVEPSAGLRELERGTLRLGASRLPVFTPATQAQRLGDAVRMDDQVFDLVKGSRVESGGGTTAWRAARVSVDLWYLEGRITQVAPVAEMQGRLMARLAAEKIEGSLLFFELSLNRKYWRALMRVPGDNAPFARWLHRWKNMPLIV